MKQAANECVRQNTFITKIKSFQSPAQLRVNKPQKLLTHAKLVALIVTAIHYVSICFGVRDAISILKSLQLFPRFLFGRAQIQ